jgi:hypothetical protein
MMQRMIADSGSPTPRPTPSPIASMLLSLLLLSGGAAGLDDISVLVVEDVTVALVGVVAVDVELVEAFTITLVVAVGGVKLADVSLRSLSFATT